MKKIVPCFILLFALPMLIHAQRKSDLIAELETLKVELDSIKSLVIASNKNERIAVAKAESLEKQTTELKDANATLLKNLNSFAQLSNKSSENMNRALEKLREKENQFSAISTAFSSYDSTAIVVLTNAKQTLGENAKVGVSNGSVIVSSSLESLFGTTTTATVSPEGAAWLEKIANILKTNPKISITIEGLSMTGELELAADQASAVGVVLKKQYGIEAERISALGKDGNFKEGIKLNFHPNYNDFYTMVKAHMKASN